jgi:glycerophosphoryl diester phosphodiesterase
MKKTVLIAVAFALLLNVFAYAEETKIVAHRGASRDAPENTLPAFRLAWEQGADAIEGDFHLTKDNQIVCIHDRNTKKVSSANLVIRESTFDELRKLDVGAYRGKTFKGTVMPTLAEVFETVPDQKEIYVEIKCGTEIIPVLLAEFKKAKLKKEQIVVISFDKRVIQEVKTQAPQYKASWLASVKKDKSGNLAPSLDSILATLKQIKADGFSSHMNNIDEAFIRRIEQAGYGYHVWTVDDASIANRFKKWGADSITTNVPGHIRSKLVD